MQIDVHWHHIPPAYIDRLRAGNDPSGDFLEIGADGVDYLVTRRLRIPLPAQLWSAPETIAELDRRELDMALVSPSPTLYQYQLSEAEAEALAVVTNHGIRDLVESHPDRFVGLGTVPLQHPKRATEWLTKCMEELGLKGARVGGAKVSEIHGNFIVNDEKASAADVLALIAKVQDVAQRERGIILETEVQIVGEEKGIHD